jgi:hypothetical protein
MQGASLTDQAYELLNELTLLSDTYEMPDLDQDRLHLVVLSLQEAAEELRRITRRTASKDYMSLLETQ